MKTLNRCLNKIQKRTAQELLEKEIYDKRVNLLIHGIKEDTKTAWETKRSRRLNSNNFYQMA